MTRVVGRSSLLVGLAAMLLAAIVLGASAASVGRRDMLRSDGKSFAEVATDPFGDGRAIVNLPAITGPSYRYGRILFPLLAWGLAGGRASLTGWTLAIVFALSVGAMVACAAELCRRRGKSPARGVAVLALPFVVGAWVNTPVVVSEPMVLALVLVTYLLVLDGHESGARWAAAAAMLTREIAVLAVLPLAWRGMRDRGWRGALDWAWVLVPYAAWSAWVRFRVGALPFLDPAPTRRNALSLPLVGTLDTMRAGTNSGQRYAMIVAAVTLAAALWAWRRRPYWPVGAGALWLALLLPFTGSETWKLWGEALRVMVPAQVLVLLCFLAGGRRAAETETAAPTPVE